MPFLSIPKEDSPSLGFRGARFLLGNRELFASQARALVRASAEGPLHVMYPMVTGTEQFLELRRLFDNVTRDLVTRDLRHGVMFEVPSACLEAADLFAVADFGSIGSNDLIQYLFAVDRNNERVAYDYRVDRPVFWRLLEQVSAAARAAGKPLSVCGELASDPVWVPRLAAIGITAVSVSPRMIPGVRLVAGARAGPAA